MKSFAVAALAGAASAAWAPPAYGAASESSMAASTPGAYPLYPTGGATSASSSIKTYYKPTTSSMMTSATPVYPTKSYAHGNNGTMSDVYVTQVVTSYETFCPYATTITTNGATYTATESETLTITDCPCQVSYPATSYTPTTVTETVSSYTTVCPTPGTYTFGQQTHTATASETITVTACPGGCVVTSEVPATWVVATMTEYYTKPAAPTTVTKGVSTYIYSEATTITMTAPTTYATYTHVVSQPTAPTSTVIVGTTYPVTSATTITYTSPSTIGYTVTAPYSSIYTAPPAYTPPASPTEHAPVPSGPMAPTGNGTAPGPYPPVQTGGAEKMVAGGAAFAAVLGALFL